MAAGQFIADYGLIVLGLAAASALALRYYAATQAGSRRLESIFFAMPWIGTVLRNVSMARFAPTIPTMSLASRY